MNLTRIIGLLVFGPMAIFAAAGIVERPLISSLLLMLYGSIAYYCALPMTRHGKAKKEKESAAKKLLDEKIAYQLETIKRGEKPTTIPKSAILRENEIAHFSAAAVLMEEKTIGYEANNTSVRIRLTNSVSAGKGNIKGKAIRKIIPVSNGELVITNLRIVFAGEVKSFEIPFQKLTNFHSIDGGLLFHIGSKSHMVRIASELIPLVEVLIKNI